MRGIWLSEGALGFEETFLRILAKDLDEMGKFLEADEGGSGFPSM